MLTNTKKYGLIAVKVALTLAFVAAGCAKLVGAAMMVQTFDGLGLGQWFRYLTGVIEIGGAALLWLNGRQVWGACLLLCTMVGAALAHLLVLGPSVVPALVLGIGASIVMFAHRDQFKAP